jgi:hypothetical protein
MPESRLSPPIGFFRLSAHRSRIGYLDRTLFQSNLGTCRLDRNPIDVFPELFGLISQRGCVSYLT